MKTLLSFALVAIISAVATASCNSQKASSPADAADSTATSEAFNSDDPSEKQAAELGLAAFKALTEGGDLAQYTEPNTSEEVKANINKMNKENYERDHNEFGMVIKNPKVVKVELHPEIDGGGVDIAYYKEYTKVEGAEGGQDTMGLALHKVGDKWYLLSEVLLQ